MCNSVTFTLIINKAPGEINEVVPLICVQQRSEKGGVTIADIQKSKPQLSIQGGKMNLQILINVKENISPHINEDIGLPK